MLHNRDIRKVHHVTARVVACPECHVNPGQVCLGCPAFRGHLSRVYLWQALTRPLPHHRDLYKMANVLTVLRVAALPRHPYSAHQLSPVFELASAARYADVYCVRVDRCLSPTGSLHIHHHEISFAAAHGVLMQSKSSRPSFGVTAWGWPWAVALPNECVRDALLTWSRVRSGKPLASQVAVLG